MTAQAVDLLVVGAGPTGLVTARELARRGLRCRIVDKAAGRSDKSRAIAIQARTLEMMDFTGIGVEPFLSEGHPVGEGRIYDQRGDLLARIDFEHLPTRHPYMLLLPQDRTEAILEQALRDCGVSIQWGVELLECAEEQDGVRAVLRHASGQQETVRAQWVVGCDGAHSAVRKSLRIPFEGGDYEDRFLLADVAAEGDLAPKAFHVFAARRGPIALFPLQNSRFRLVVDDVPPSWGDEPTLAQCQQLVDERSPCHIVLADPHWISTFHLHHRKTSSMRSGRVLLAGDAAHIHSPAGGQGMNTGIQDAMNLGWKLAMCVQGAARTKLLDTYDAERRRVVDEVLRMSDRITRLMGATNPVTVFVRDHLMPVAARIQWVRARAGEAVSELAIVYPEGAILDANDNARRDTPGPGDRAPDAEVLGPAGRPMRLYEAMRHAGFTAVLPATPARDLREHCEARGVRALSAVRGDPYDPQRAYLVRPDGYLAVVATPDRFEQALAAFANEFFTTERLAS